MWSVVPTPVNMPYYVLCMAHRTLPIPVAHPLSRPLSYWPMWSLLGMPLAKVWRCHNVFTPKKILHKILKVSIVGKIVTITVQTSCTLPCSRWQWSQLCGLPQNCWKGQIRPPNALGVKATECWNSHGIYLKTLISSHHFCCSSSS